jgi:hypothetical protein
MKKEKPLNEISLDELVEKAILERVDRRNRIFRLINLLILGIIIGTIIYFFF